MNWSRAVAALLVPPQRAFPHASYALSELCVLGVVCGEDSARIRLPSTRRRVVGVRFPDSCEDRHLCGRNTRWQSCGQRPIDPPGTPRPRPMLRGALWAGAAAGASRALKTLPLASRHTLASIRGHPALRSVALARRGRAACRILCIVLPGRPYACLVHVPDDGCRAGGAAPRARRARRPARRSGCP